MTVASERSDRTVTGNNGFAAVVHPQFDGLWGFKLTRNGAIVDTGCDYETFDRALRNARFWVQHHGGAT